MPLANGTRVGPYEIVSLLGAGGMGDVYRARDTKLGRDVALKVLPRPFASDHDRLARFEREAQLLASLNHPNIATIHGFEESTTSADAPVRALVLELVEGLTLAERLTRGPVPIAEVLDIGSQIAAALEAAHSRGVIHRDLKPANVKVTPDGRVKLLDFGLAKTFARDIAQGSSEAETIAVAATESWMILGTPAYMSPEQVRGRTVDERADVWAFGCVLLELLTGRQAFQGDTWADSMAAVLEREPDLRGLPPSTPANIYNLLTRCLQKDASVRLHRMAEARIELQESLRAPASARPPEAARTIASVAVLPFDNASGDPQMEYLSDGLTESIILSLSQLRELRVMARSTVFRYKGQTREPQSIGRALGVGAVLSGRVLQRGETLVVSAELVDVGNGWQLWGAQYKRPVADIFATEERIAEEISGALRVTLTPAARQLLAKRHTDNLEAYHLYLKGRFYWGKRTADALNRALQYYRQSIEADPTYALAYGGLAECYVPLAFYGHMFPREAWLKARAAAQKAIEIEPALPEARTVLARVTTFDWDPAAGEKEFRAVIEQNPEYSRARQGLAENLVATGRFEEAAAQIQRALESDPLSSSINTAVALIFYYSRRYDQAIDQLRATIDMDPGFYPAHSWLGLALEQQGKFEEAESELQQAARLSSHSTLVMASLGGLHAASGREAEARRILAELDDNSQRKYVSQTSVAVISARLGDKDRALACLEQACEDRCPWVMFLMVDPRLDALRAGSDLHDLLRRMRLPHSLGRTRSEELHPRTGATDER